MKSIGILIQELLIACQKTKETDRARYALYNREKV